MIIHEITRLVIMKMKMKMKNIHTAKIDLGLYMDINIVNKMFLGMMMLMCIKKHLSKIWSSINVKVTQQWG